MSLVDGVAVVLRAIEKETKRIDGALRAALYQEGLAIDAKAVSLMPVDTGRMRATHYVTPPQLDGGEPVVELGVGAEYAVYVHERTDTNHPVGSAKFYEIPLNEARTGYQERIRNRTVENMAAGVTMVPTAAPTTPAKSSVTLDKKTAARTGTTERGGRR